MKCSCHAGQRNNHCLVKCCNAVRCSSGLQLLFTHCAHYFRCVWIIVLDLVKKVQEVAALQPHTNQSIMEGRLLVVGGLLVAREEAWKMEEPCVAWYYHSYLGLFLSVSESSLATTLTISSYSTTHSTTAYSSSSLDYSTWTRSSLLLVFSCASILFCVEIVIVNVILLHLDSAGHNWSLCHNFYNNSLCYM